MNTQSGGNDDEGDIATIELGRIRLLAYGRVSQVPCWVEVTYEQVVEPWRGEARGQRRGWRVEEVRVVSDSYMVGRGGEHPGCGCYAVG